MSIAGKPPPPFLAMMSGSAGNGAWPRPCRDDGSFMASTGTQDAGLGAVNNQDRNPGERLELSPHGRDGAGRDLWLRDCAPAPGRGLKSGGRFDRVAGWLEKDQKRCDEDHNNHLY